ncbi:peptidase B [Photobacterium aphoticum]|uniref:Peptidase B n=1 Tax=Photobacterium aphoticum TaxID=754436 RepID=A0A090RMS6_9GAMM|nr:peptidase B [Photobacterium aphoticum]
MSVKMNVFLSHDAAAPQWGANALVTFQPEGAVVHLTGDNALVAVQRAGRKLDGQGIKQVVLGGEGWDLETVWAFIQGHRNSKPGNTVEWPALSEQDEAELQARIMATEWVREIINQSAEVVRPSQLAARAGEWIKALAPEQVTYKIVKGNDLLDEAGTVFIPSAVVQSVRLQCCVWITTQPVTRMRRFIPVLLVKGSLLTRAVTA